MQRHPQNCFKNHEIKFEIYTNKLNITKICKTCLRKSSGRASGASILIVGRLLSAKGSTFNKPNDFANIF